MSMISFLADDDSIVEFPKNLLQYTNFLEMLFRRKSENIIKTGVNQYDLQLTKAICALNFIPSSRQTIIRPVDFSSFDELCDYMGIIGIEFEDKTDKYLNDFLSYMGELTFHIVNHIKMRKSWAHWRSRSTPVKAQINLTIVTDDDVDENGQIVLNRWIDYQHPDEMEYSDDEWFNRCFYCEDW